MRTLFFIIILVIISQCFSAFQMRNIDKIDIDEMSELALKINQTGQLNQYERKF